MAVVIKHINIETSTERSKSNASENRKDYSKRHVRDGTQNAISDHVTIHVNGSPVNNAITESLTLAPKSSLERPGDTRSLSKRSDRRSNNILDIKAESLPSYRFDEEVVGIITMEDLMEELLQEEILDETDEYVDVHNKIKINMLPPKGSSSLGPQSLSQFLRRSPITSPHYHSSSLLHSPASPISQASGSITTIVRAEQSVPAEIEGIRINSSNAYQVLRKQ